MKDSQIQILLNELYGQQSALNTLVSIEFEKIVENPDSTFDTILQIIILHFPYDFIFDLLLDIDFFFNFNENN